MRGFRWFLVAAAAAALSAYGPTPPMRADTGDFDELMSPDADAADLRARLPETARRLRAGLDWTTRGTLTILSPGSDSEREDIAQRLAGLWKAGADALRPLGFSVPAEPPPMTVILVRMKGVSSDFVRAAGSQPILLLREGQGFKAPEPPPVAARADGLAVRRDAIAAARATRLWIAKAAASATSRSGEPYALARQVVASVTRDATPTSPAMPVWLREGLIAWVEARCAPGGSAHVCKSFQAPSPALLARLFGEATASTPVGARLLGRMLDVLVAGKSDVPSRLDAVAREGAAPEKAIEAAFGMSALDALTKACETFKDAAGACDEKSVIPCPACKGIAKLELSCPECDGTGNIACPSCEGADSCPAECSNGFVVYESGKKLKCRVCSGGKLKCQACAGAMRAACKSCSGTGKSSWPCLACRATGRVACPEAGAAADAAAGTPCPWCQDASRQFACPDCTGVGYLGCEACDGSMRQVCPECIGTGEIRMVYTDGTTASASKCQACDGKGWFRCKECSNGRKACTRCGGKGRGRFEAAGCPACDAGKVPTLASLRAKRLDGDQSIDEKQAERNKAMLERAVEFLLTCNQTNDGSFALRRFRQGGQAAAGALTEPTLFSNAMVLWTLAVVGVDGNDRRTQRAWDVLRRQSQEIVSGTAEYMSTQGTGLAIRAFAAAGEDPKSPILTGLIDKLVKGQHASGWWGDSLNEKDPDDALDSLLAIEALRVARVKGVKVPRAVWGKALRAASAEFEGKGPAGMKSAFMSASEVLSNMALLVMAKEGSLGSKATEFDYQSMPAIRKGLAWLDRYFDIRREAQFVKGAAVKVSSDAGYSAYIFAVQRLAMLLSIEVLAGERWHATGADYLATIQHKDGSFEESSLSHLNGPVRTTTSCVLFLARATAPITNGDDGD